MNVLIVTRFYFTLASEDKHSSINPGHLRIWFFSGMVYLTSRMLPPEPVFCLAHE